MRFTSWLRPRKPQSARRGWYRSVTTCVRLRFDALEERLCLSEVSFGPPITWNSGGSSAAYLAVGDFNGDDHADLGVANYDYDTASVSVLFGNGDGEFSAPKSFVVGGPSSSVAAADFNGDGFDDLAVEVSGNVKVLLGGTSGNMVPSALINLASAWDLTVGDFNSDGNPDLAVGTFLPRLYVLLGDGSGGFEAPATINLGTGTFPSVVVGDFNGDSHTDLAAPNVDNGALSVLLGDGSGNFGIAPPIQNAFVANYGVAAGDFNGDGFDDLVTLADATTVNVRISQGTGAFNTPVSLHDEKGPIIATVGDFDGDGNVDIAVGNADRSLSVFIGDGQAGFAPQVDFPLGARARSVVVGDFNSDGRSDVAAGEGVYVGPNLVGPLTVVLNTTPYNQPPVVDNQAFSLNENSASDTIVGTVAASDPDIGQTLSYQITAGNFGGAFTINSGTGQIAVANSAALDYETTPTFSLTVQVTDNGSPAKSSTATITVTLNNINEAPVNNIPSFPQKVTKNKSLTFSRANGNAISISDPDSSTTLIQVSLTVLHGKLTLAGTVGLSFLAGDGKSDGTMTFQGSIAVINAALDGLSYVPDKGFTGPDSLTIATNDLGSGLGDPLIATNVLAILVEDKK